MVPLDAPMQSPVLELRCASLRLLMGTHVAPCRMEGRLVWARHYRVLGHGAVWFQPHTVSQPSAGSDAGVTSDSDTVADYCTRTDIHRVADYGAVTDARLPVNPTAGPNAATRTDTDPCLGIGRRLNVRRWVGYCAAADETATVGVTTVG